MRNECSISDDHSRPLREWLGKIESRLTSAGADAPHLDAGWLLAHALGVDREELARRGDELLPESAVQPLEILVADRERGVPLAYLLGEWEFWSLPLFVTSDVLVPRAETELLVEWEIERMRSIDAPRIADLGTGSGCIAIALATELSTAFIDAVDLLPNALEIARRNIERHQVSDRIALHEGDLLAPLVGEPPYDLIVSNPPYVVPGDPNLEAAVGEFEPDAALYDVAGGDGLGFYRRIAEEAPNRLTTTGSILVELPEDGAAAVRALFEGMGFVVETRHDLAGIERALRAARA